MHEKKLVHIERKNLKIHVDPSLVEPHPHGNTYQSIHHAVHIFAAAALTLPLQQPTHPPTVCWPKRGDEALFLVSLCYGHDHKLSRSKIVP
mgnify:CR=1 FL=1